MSSPAFLHRRVARPLPPPPPEPEPVVEAWPIFWVRTSLDGCRNPLRAGDLWEEQDKRWIRMWGSAFGLSDDETRQRPFHLLPFVETLTAPSKAVADHIIKERMRIDEARRYLGIKKGRHGKR
jgi:hypothetical protein